MGRKGGGPENRAGEDKTTVIQQGRKRVGQERQFYHNLGKRKRGILAVSKHKWLVHLCIWMRGRRADAEVKNSDVFGS